MLGPCWGSGLCQGFGRANLPDGFEMDPAQAFLLCRERLGAPTEDVDPHTSPSTEEGDQACGLWELWGSMDMKVVEQTG